MDAAPLGDGRLDVDQAPGVPYSWDDSFSLASKVDATQISAEYKAAKELCKPMKDNAQDVCEKEAKGKEKVAKAELNAKSEAGSAQELIAFKVGR